MTNTPLDDALTSALRGRAETLTRAAPPVSEIRRRSTRRRARRRRNNVAATMVVALVVGAAMWGLARPPHRVTVATGPAGAPGTTSPLGTPGAGLADTTTSQTCANSRTGTTLPATTITPRPQTSASVDLPDTIPAGLCVVSAVSAPPATGSFRLTALADCTNCSQPLAAVAVSRSSKRDTWANGTTVGQQSGVVAGKTYAYKPPAAPGARAMLAVPDDSLTDGGSNPNGGFVLIGYGLTKDQYLTLAGQLVNNAAPSLPRLHTVFDGVADSNDNIVLAGIDAYAAITWITPDGNTILTYTYQRSSQLPPVTAFAWQYPQAKPSRGQQSFIAPVRNGWTTFSEPSPGILVTLDYRSTASDTANSSGQVLPILDHLQTLSTTTSTWTMLVTAAQHHQNNANYGLYNP